MTHRKLIAFACSLLLTLCGLAYSQNQQSWGGMALMRGSGGVRYLGPPDPYEGSLALLWGFDELPHTNSSGKVFDTSGNGLVGTLDAGTPTFREISTNEYGAINYGLYTATATLYCRETNTFASVVSPNETSEYTMSWWVNLNNTAVNQANYLWQDTSANRKSFTLRNGGVRDMHSHRTNVLDAIKTVNTVELGVWHMLTMTFKTNDWRVYTNAVLVATDTSVTTGPTNLIAAFYASCMGYAIDRVSLYKIILNNSDITNLWLNTHPTNRIWRK